MGPRRAAEPSQGAGFHWGVPKFHIQRPSWEVMAETEAQGPGRGERPPHLQPERRSQALESAAARFFRRTHVSRFQPPFPSRSSCPPKSRARLAPIGQQSRPSTNTFSSSSFGRRWLTERRSHWLVLRKRTRRDCARGGLVQLVQSYGPSPRVRPPNPPVEGLCGSLFELSRQGKVVRKKVSGYILRGR